jgi:hypothetical protein
MVGALAARAAPGALVASGAWALSGVAAVAYPGWDPGPIGSASYFVIETTHAVAETGMLFALAGTLLPQRGSIRRIGTSAFWLALAATALLALMTYLSVVLPLSGIDPTAGSQAVASTLFLVSLLGTLIGYVAFGIATVRARLGRPGIGVLLVAHPALISVLLFFYPAGLVLGLLWFGIGALLSRGPLRAAAPQPAR